MNNRFQLLALPAMMVGLLLAGCQGQPAETATTTAVADVETFTSTPAPTATATAFTAATVTASTTATIAATPTQTPTNLPTASAAATAAATATATAAPSVRPATETPTAIPPTATSTPAEPSSEAIIDYFQANVDVADPGDTITLEWATTNAAQVFLYRLMRTGQFGSFWEVDPAGDFVYDIGERERNSTRFALAATDAQGVTSMATLSVRLRCTAEWFISQPPEVCPLDPPLVSAAAEQHFQRGVMIWVEAEDRILVLYDDGNSPRWKWYRDEWDPGEPELDPELVPPAGLYQPVRGFGLLWRTEPSVQERLGWAVDQETAYQTKVQYTSYAKYNSVYVRALDGAVWYLRPEGSRWEKIDG